MYRKRIKDMVDPDDCEACAMHDASKIAGAYIAELRIKGTREIPEGDPIEIYNTDRFYFINWTREEWKGFIETVITSYVDSIQSQHEKIQRSINKVTHLP